jgi:hypothetical protein
MQKEIIIGMVITIVLLLLVIIWAIFVRKEKYNESCRKIMQEHTNLEDMLSCLQLTKNGIVYDDV